MRALKLFLAAVVFLFVASTAQAQCGRPTPQYNGYHSETGSYTKNGGFVIITTTSASGYSSGMSGCPSGSVTHTLSAKNLLTETHSNRTVGGWHAGTPGCPSCQISVSNTQSTSVTNGEFWQEDDQWNVACSQAGMFGGSGLLPFIDAELAVTLVQDQGLVGTPGPNGKTYFPVSYFCSSASSPPDWQPRQVLSVSRLAYALGVTVCFRPAIPGTPFICVGSVAEQLRLPAESFLQIAAPAIQWVGVSYDCTNFDRNISGLPTPWPF